METKQNNEGRAPLADLTNIINGVGQATSNSQAQVDERAQRKREREKARYVAMTQEEKDEKNRRRREMTQEEKDEKNKKRRENRHMRKTETTLATGLRGRPVGGESTTESIDGYEDSDWLHRNNSYEPMEIDKDNTYEYFDRCVDQSGMINTDASPDLNPGVVNASNSIDNIFTCPKERKRELDRARRAAMSPEQKALLNKRRRDLYAQKNAARKLQMTAQVKKLKRNESHKTYKRTVPELQGTPVYIAPAEGQNPEVETLEFDAAHTIHRHRVTSGERNAFMSRRNQAFEANIGRNARGCANGKCDNADDPTHPSVVYNDGVTQETPVPPPINCTGTQAQPSVVDVASPMPQNSAQADTPDSMVDDDYDADVIFEDDEEEDAYFFVGQEYNENGNEVEHNDDTDEQENNEPDVPDPFDRVYANLSSESHMLPSVPNSKHCDAKKFEGEPPGFCCRGGKIRLSNPDTPPELMRLWTSSDADARHFRSNIRYFNGHFSFTSLYCHLDRVTTNMKLCGAYTFRAHGQIYHNIRSFGKEDGVEKRHLELYFYDDDPSLEHRMSKCCKDCFKKDIEVIEQLVGILHGNPYSQELRRMGHVENLEDNRVELNLDQRLDQRTHNVPLASEVATVWVEGSVDACYHQLFKDI